MEKANQKLFLKEQKQYKQCSPSQCFLFKKQMSTTDMNKMTKIYQNNPEKLKSKLT